MPIRDRNKWPQGGWAFFQPQTNWKAPDPMANSFDSQVSNIIKHRLANPRFNLSVDRSAVEKELDDFTCLRLGNNPQWCLDLGATPKSPAPETQKKTLLNAIGGAVARFVERANQVNRGRETLQDWFGDGMQPVSEWIANQRADVCLACPKHDKGDWFDQFTGAIAEKVKSFVELKNSANLKVRNEEQLKTCGVCGCHLATKVWVPLQNIESNTDPEDMDDFPATCWIKKESKRELETVIVQLGRTGDLINILPVALEMAKRTRRRTRIVTHIDFKPILESCPYVNPIYWPGPMHDGIAASKMVQSMPFEPPGIKIVSPMLFGNLVHANRTRSNFLIEQWAVLGFEKEWGKLPLMFDRNPEGEASVKKELGASGNYLVLALESFSSPCPFDVRQKIKNSVPKMWPDCQVIDVSDYYCPNFVWMLGLLEDAQLIVTVDTAIIHLNRALKTKAILFSKPDDNLWHSSHIVENVQECYTYNEVDKFISRRCQESVPRSNPVTVVMGGDDTYRSLANLCRISVERTKIGRCIQFDPLPSVERRDPSWWKISAMLSVLKELNENEWVMWIDADCTVRPMMASPPFGDFDIMISQDWNGLCMAVFAVNNTPFSRKFLETLLFLGTSKQTPSIHGQNDGPKWEQDAMKSLLALFPNMEKRVGKLPSEWTTDHPPKDPGWRNPIHHWGGRPLNLRADGMKKDIGPITQQELIIFCYLPPRNVNPECQQAFKDNLKDNPPVYPLVFISDDVGHLPNRVCKPIPVGTTTHETSVHVFEQVMRGVEDYRPEYFMVIEPDCRVNLVGWDLRIFDALKKKGRFVCAGTPVAFHQSSDLLEEYGKASNVWINALKSNEWLDESQPLCFPNGAFAIYNTEDAITAWKKADRTKPWDLALALELKRIRSDYSKKFWTSGEVLSFGCEAWITRKEMKKRLEKRQCIAIHSIKDGWKPELNQEPA